MHFAEHKRLMDMLDTDREQILIEKTKLETMERIKPTVSKESTKRHTEIDAAIKIAQVLLVVCSFYRKRERQLMICSRAKYRICYGN